MPHEPRPYQSGAIETLRMNAARGVRRQLLVAPTGSGKTTIAAIIIEGAIRKAKRVWFLAHRRELINQCSKRLDNHGVDHGIIQAKHPRIKPWLPVQIVSVHTVIRGKRLETSEAPDLIFIDEAHRSLSDSYIVVMDAFPNAIIIGLTATPWRLDGKPLGDRYDKLVVAATPQELIDLGYLIPPRVFAPSVPNLSSVRSMGGDYKNDEAFEVMKGSTIVGDVITHWQDKVQNSRNPLTVLFAVNKDHSRMMVSRFRDAGVTAEHIDESTSAKERDRILEDLATGQVKVVSNCQILTEGWDLPQLGCVELCRPTKSLALYLQMAGRGMRPWEDEEDFLLMDHAGCVIEHGFPQEDREYSLDVPAKKRNKNETGPAVTVCKECFAIYPSSDKKCPMCGYERPVQEREIQEDKDAELQELTPQQLKEIRRKKARKIPWLKRLIILMDFLQDAAKFGYADGWAAFMFQDKIGDWPPSRMMQQAKEEAVHHGHYNKRYAAAMAVCEFLRGLGERRENKPDHAAYNEGSARGPGLPTERSEDTEPQRSMDAVRHTGDDRPVGDSVSGRVVLRDRDEAGERETHEQESNRTPSKVATNG